METASRTNVFYADVARILAVALGLITTFAAVPDSAAVEYESRELEFSGSDINDRGWVVGTLNGSASLRAGRVRTLASNATANAVNNAGVVVGSRTDASGTRAFRTTPALSDAIEDLGLLPGGTYSHAITINEAGTAVGSANTKLPDGKLVYQAVYFPVGEQRPVSLGHFAGNGGTAAYANGINDRGDIVGVFMKADGKYRPFLYLASGELIPLPGFDDAVEATATAINNSGRIIGNVTYKDGRQRGFIFENGAHTDIEAPVPSDGKTTRASGLNDAGQVVGGYYASNSDRPYLLDKGVTVDLKIATLGSVNQPAYAINNRGEILSSYCDSAGCRPKLLTPRRPPPVERYTGLPLQRAATPYSGFGSALTLHGNVAVIGASGEGAAYVYRYGDTGWAEEHRLTPTDPIPGEGFGASVAFDGTTIVVGDRNADAAYVFQASASGWAQTATLSTGMTTPTTSGFGTAVDVKGGRIVVGAPYARENGSDLTTGAVYVFEGNGSQWSRTKLPTDLPVNTSSCLGASVQFDGDSILVGAPSCWWSSYGDGAVYVFQRQATGWSNSKLTPSAPSGKIDFGVQIVVRNDVLAVWSGRSRTGAYLFRRGTPAENTPWVEQDWFTSHGPVAVDGDRLVVVENYSGKYLPKILKRDGRIWVDEFNVTSESTSVSALALQGSTLLIGSSTIDGGIVIPFSICAQAPCPDDPVANVQVMLDAPKIAYTSELMTHTVVVKNLNTNATAGLVTTESTFTDSNGIAPGWIGVPDTCQVSASRMRVTCSVIGLAANAEARFELRIAAPAAAGTFTHKATALHSRPDPAPENNTATVTTAILPSGEARIEIRNPENGALIPLAPHEALDLELDIVNFGVGLAGNFYTVTIDGKPAQHFTTKQSPISLGELSEGKHSVTISLMTADSDVPVLTKTVNFAVEIIAPSVAIRFPGIDDQLTCHKGEIISPDITLRHFMLGASGRGFVLRIDGIDVGGTNSSVSILNTIDLCALQLDTPHLLQVVLRDSDGIKADSGALTFVPRKAVPKVTIQQPNNGGVDYARGGFSLIYVFERGYDTTQLAAFLNGSPIAGPLPAVAGTNAVPLPAALLRDGANELLMTVTMEGQEVQTSAVRFNTQTEVTPPKSKGGALGLWSLLLLMLMPMARRK